MNHQAVLRKGGTIQLPGGGGEGFVAFEFDKLFFTFPSAELYIFTLCLKKNIYFLYFNLSSVYNVAPETRRNIDK